MTMGYSRWCKGGNLMILQGKKISVKFKEKKALNSVNFKIEKGEIYSILGHNGAGKSTLVKVIMDLVDYEGELIMAFDHELLYTNVSVQLQTNSFEDGVKVWEICKLYKDLLRSDYDINQLLLDFDLKKQENQFVNNLSGGQRQKLTILLTLLNNPQVIIFDELTTGLDVLSRHKIWEILKRINKEKGTTLILTSHFLDEVEYLADNVLILENGKAKVVGKVRDIIQKLFGDKKKAQFRIDHQFKFGKFKFDFSRKQDMLNVEYNSSNEQEIYQNIVDCGGYDITMKTFSFEDAFLKILGYELGKDGEITHE